MIVAKWSMNIYKADAQKVAEEIISIGDEATPAQIVEKAKDENTELHKCFIWDDRIAAEHYRLYQARHIVRLLIIHNTDEPDDPDPVRFFYKVDREHDTGYKMTTKIVRNDDEYKALLRQAKAELDSFRKKYKTLKELDGVFDAIDEIL